MNGLQRSSTAGRAVMAALLSIAMLSGCTTRADDDPSVTPSTEAPGAPAVTVEPSRALNPGDPVVIRGTGFTPPHGGGVARFVGLALCGVDDGRDIGCLGLERARIEADGSWEIDDTLWPEFDGGDGPGSERARPVNVDCREVACEVRPFTAWVVGVPRPARISFAHGPKRKQPRVRVDVADAVTVTGTDFIPGTVVDTFVCAVGANVLQGCSDLVPQVPPTVVDDEGTFSRTVPLTSPAGVDCHVAGACHVVATTHLTRQLRHDGPPALRPEPIPFVVPGG